MKYFIFTYGCQMNENDSEKLSGILDKLGHEKGESPQESDLIILHTCSVRENANDKFFGKLGVLKKLKEKNNDLIIDDYNVLDNITLKNNNSLEDALYYLKILHMEYIINRNVKNLSGGEKRILLIIRGFLIDKDILLIDEPTNDLDLKHVNKLLVLLEEMKTQKAIVIVSHDDRIKKVSDYVYEMLDGKILSASLEGQKKEFVEKPTENILPIFKFNCLKIIFYIFVIFTFVFILLYIENNYNEINLINDCQIDICTNYAINAEKLFDKGYLPLNVYREYEGNIDINYLKKIKNVLNDPNINYTTSRIDIGKSEKYDLYEIAFVNKSNGNVINMNSIINDIYFQEENKYLKIINFDLDEAFIVDYEDNIEIVEEVVTIEDFEMLVEVLKNSTTDELSNIYYTLIIKDHFDIKNEFNDLSSHTFVRNNETINIVNTYNRYNINKTYFIILIVIFFSLLLITFANGFVDLKVNKKVYESFRNVGINFDKCFKELVKKKNSFLFFILVEFTIGLVYLIRMFYATNLKFYYSILLVTVLVVFLIYFIERLLYYKGLKKIYNFGGIFE